MDPLLNESPMKGRTGGYKICNLCGQSVINNHLKNHARVKHLKAPVAQCPQCGHEELWHVSNMRKHIREVHSEISAEPVVIPIDKDAVKLWKDKCFLGASIGCPTPRHSKSANRKRTPKSARATVQMHESSDQALSYEDEANNSLPLKKRKLSSSDMTADRNLADKLDGVVCAECQAVVSADRAEMHVRTQHMRQPMFKCSQCKFSTIWYEAHVQQHISKYHQGDNATIESLPSDEATFQLLMHRCFPQNVQVNQAYDEYEQPGQSQPQVKMEEEPTNNSKRKRVRKSRGKIKMPDLDEVDSDEEEASARCTSLYCVPCHKRVQDSRRHVWKCHMRKKVFKCGQPKCNFGTDDPPSQIVVHSYAVHGQDTMPKVRDTRKDFSSQFVKVFKECYMKPKDRKTL